MVLSNPELRRIYDEEGYEGLEAAGKLPDLKAESYLSGEKQGN